MFYNVHKKKRKNLIVQRNSLSNSISSSEFNELMEKIGLFQKKPLLAISYSGGPDSTALLLKLCEWSKNNGAKLISFIINHNLKENSMEESEIAKKNSESLLIETHILNWQGSKPKSKIMKTARDKRYELLEQECKKRHIFHLFTAHHLDDQIETYLMRSQRKGFDLGQSSMNVVTEKENFRIIKPFLFISKKRLIDTCKYHKMKWNNDKMNHLDNFERVRTRKILKNINSYQKTVFLKKIQLKKKMKIITEYEISKFIYDELIFFKHGLFSFKKDSFLNLQSFLQYEILKRILLTNSGKQYGPRLKCVKRIVKFLKNKYGKQTLHSSIIENKNNIVNIYRECKKTFLNTDHELILKKNEVKLWDYRFLIYSNQGDLVLININETNVEKIKKKFNNFKGEWMPGNILQTLPLIKTKNKFLIPFISSTREMSMHGIKFYFNPKNSLTSNKISIGI